MGGMMDRHRHTEEGRFSTAHCGDEESTATDTRKNRRTCFIDSVDTSSPKTSPPPILNANTSSKTKRESCDLSKEQDRYDWELVDLKALQIALNFNDELKSWNNNKKKLENMIYTINKGYLALRLNHLPENTQIEEIRRLFNQAWKDCDPNCILKAWSLEQDFSKLLNKDMARIVKHDIDKGCSKFSCDTLYTTQDGTKAIASILFHHPELITYCGTVYRGVQHTDDFPDLQVNRSIMIKTFLSTSTDPAVADMFAAYDRTEQKFFGEDKEGMTSVLYTFKIKNSKGNRRALDIRGISQHPDEEEILLLPYGSFLITKRELIELPNQKAKRLELELEECDEGQLKASVTPQNL